MAASTIMLNMFPKITNACHAMAFTYPLEVDITLHIFSVITVKMLSEFEFWIRWINSFFKKVGIRLAHSIYHGTHNCEREDCNFNNHDINDCNNWVHRLKKKGIKIINQANTKRAAMI